MSQCLLDSYSFAQKALGRLYLVCRGPGGKRGLKPDPSWTLAHAAASLRQDSKLEVTLQRLHWALIRTSVVKLEASGLVEGIYQVSQSLMRTALLNCSNLGR